MIHQINNKHTRYLVKLKDSRLSKRLSRMDPADDITFYLQSSSDLWSVFVCVYIILSGDTKMGDIVGENSKYEMNRLII